MSIPDMADTIVARSTAEGKAAISVVRLSGPGTRTILEHAIDGSAQDVFHTARRLRRKWILDGNKRRVDEVLVAFFPAPNSYTGQDVAEVHTHGGQKVTAMVVDSLLAAGARTARPGEFTWRAFENGKLDLSAAEAVAHIIDARTEAEVLGARRAVEGELGKWLERIREELLGLMTRIEANIDFPDEPEVSGTVEADLSALQVRVKKLGCQLRRVADADAEVVFCGPVNVGKSSLVNAISSRKISIVTPEAGTTRDAVRTDVTLHGLKVGLVDTAGIGIGEKAGMADLEAQKVARHRISKATMAVWMSEVGAKEDGELPDVVESIRVVNKADLLQGQDRETTRRSLAEKSMFLVSAKTKAGVEELVDEIGRRLLQKQGPADGLPMTSRQTEALDTLQAALTRASDALDAGGVELAAEDLKAALDAVGELSGERVEDDILDRIFSRFCIGK